MKKLQKKIQLAMMFAMAMTFGFGASVASADGLTITGKWAGAAFPAALIDVNGDGVPGRTLTAKVYSARRMFTELQGILDIAIVAFPGAGTCSDPAAFELEAFGTIILRGWGNSAIYGQIDPSTHLCFNPAAPNELMAFTVVGGTGLFEGMTGTGTATLHDRILSTSADGTVAYLIDTQGEFSVTVQ